MSKKHFIALANTIRDFNTQSNGGGIDRFLPRQIEALANLCQSQNPRFNRERWLDYINGKCGPNGGQVKP